MKVRKLSPRERRIAVFTAAIILGGLLWVKVLEPVVQRWVWLRREVAGYEEELSRMKGLLAQKDAIEAAMERIGRSAFSQGSEDRGPDVLLEEVERMAAASGLNLLYLKPRQVKGRNLPGELSAELKVEGTMRDLGELLHDFQTSMLLLQTQQLTVTVGRDPGQVQAVIRVVKLSGEES